MFRSQAVTRIFFATDIHGSEKCWRKFINAAKFYDAGILIMGGDITGKHIVPVLKEPTGAYASHYMNAEHRFSSETEVVQFEKSVRDHGYYPVRLKPDEVAEYHASPERADQLFRQVMLDSLCSWVQLAEDRLKGTDIHCYVVPGNDDIAEVDAVLAQSERIVNPEQQCVWLDSQHEMIASGYTNPTPWNTTRECSEEALAARLAPLFARASRPENLVACLHTPPFGSQLDVAPQLTSDYRLDRSLGQVKMVPVGSKAVAQAIERHQPLLGLHGHIHESRGVKKIGRTVCINPGSEYTEGVLSGAIIELSSKGLQRFQLVSG